MYEWSRYNTLFESGKHGGLLYNALTGAMLQLDARHYQLAGQLRDGQAPAARAPQQKGDEPFLDLLKSNGVLAERGQQEATLEQLHAERRQRCSSTELLDLTICPTLACNFACPYCFEQATHQGAAMNEATMQGLLRFIERHAEVSARSVCWYGGEPTLAFGVVEALTEQLIARYADYGNARMVTNGYLLDKEKIARLDELRITTIQVTLDGTEAIHDQRRMVAGGGKSFARILSNLDELLHSSWKGRCAVRINIDKSNQQSLAPLHALLMERYQGRNISIEPAPVTTFQAHSYNRAHGFTNTEWAAFVKERYHKEGIMPPGGFFPETGKQSGCVATNRYGYVVGPKGELYKCWEDVGNAARVIGSVHDEELGNPMLAESYAIGSDPFSDETCRQCPVLPICGGGCPRKRLRAKLWGEADVEYCSLYKESLTDYLDAYVETWHSRQLCNALLGKGEMADAHSGYRLLQPDVAELKASIER